MSDSAEHETPPPASGSIRFGAAAWAWFRAWFVGMAQVLHSHLVLILLVAGGVFLLAGWMFPRDPGWLAEVQSGSTPKVQEITWYLSESGKFHFVPLLLPVVIFLAGWWLGRPHLRKAALVILMAGIIAGLAVNVLRPAYGRARPSSEFEPGFYGPSAQHQFNSFPSGHATTAWATAVSTTMLCPPLGPPTMVWAAGTTLSRMYQNAHYPSDIIAGGALGSFIGWLSVAGLRRMNRAQKPPK